MAMPIKIKHLKGKKPKILNEGTKLLVGVVGKELIDIKWEITHTLSHWFPSHLNKSPA